MAPDEELGRGADSAEQCTDFSPGAKYSISMPGLAHKEYREQCGRGVGGGAFLMGVSVGV